MNWHFRVNHVASWPPRCLTSALIEPLSQDWVIPFIEPGITRGTACGQEGGGPLDLKIGWFLHTSLLLCNHLAHTPCYDQLRVSGHWGNNHRPTTNMTNGKSHSIPSVVELMILRTTDLAFGICGLVSAKTLGIFLFGMLAICSNSIFSVVQQYC